MSSILETSACSVEIKNMVKNRNKLIDIAGHSDITINQSINQSNPVLLKERVRIPSTRRAGGAAML